MSISITPPNISHRELFLKAVKTSKGLHASWVKAPKNKKEFDLYLKKSQQDNCAYFLVIADKEIAGVVNISEIIFGNFRSAFLGYYAFQRHAGQGVMQQALKLVIIHAFKTLKLHRLEANIQPENSRSIRLVQHLGFTKEGYSRGYLKVYGKWKDHERWAILSDDWKNTF